MPVVKLTITHSISTGQVMEKRYVLEQTIASIKTNLATHFNTPPEKQRLVLKDDTGKIIEEDMKDEKLLGYYQARDEFTVHIVDLQPRAQYEDYSDLSQVEKFQLSEEEWLKRPDNVRAYKQRMLEKQRAEMEAQGIPLPEEINDESFAEKAAAMKVGDRCQVSPGDRLGEVKYVGRISMLKPGFWVGVEFDEPVGKSDGSVKGTRIFECKPKYGGIVRPDMVEVGDFPPEEF